MDPAQPRRPQLILPKTAQLPTAQPEYQLFLKLPTGESVQIPMVQPTLSTAAALIPALRQEHPETRCPRNQMSTQPCQAVDPQANGPGSATLRTIRTVLTGNESSQSQLEAAAPGVCPPETRAENGSETAHSQARSEVRSGESDHGEPPGERRSKGGRKPRHEPKSDPDERKINSLERNREAAMRCRTKRKVFVGALEEKADELENYNRQLQGQVDKLTRDVSLFKAALLSHKDCSVFHTPPAGRILQDSFSKLVCFAHQTDVLIRYTHILSFYFSQTNSSPGRPTSSTCCLRPRLVVTARVQAPNGKPNRDRLTAAVSHGIPLKSEYTD